MQLAAESAEPIEILQAAAAQLRQNNRQNVSNASHRPPTPMPPMIYGLEMAFMPQFDGTPGTDKPDRTCCCVQ